jgi:polyisoprenoid-binding protein YceI
MRLDLIYCFTLLAFPSVSRAQAPEGVPVVRIVREESSVKFKVKASVAIEGVFDKWDATLTYTSPKVESGVLDVKIEAASVNTAAA